MTGKKDTVIGGSYTPLPYDSDFFSTFQSIFVNYFELKKREPDYIATHSMAIEKRVFERSGGFPETFLPIIEDVEFSHRLRRSGYRLLMDSDILVRHIFNFTFAKSIRNAFRKSHYWMMYSLGNRDLFADSGTASRELKVNVLSNFLILLFLLLSVFAADSIFLALSLMLLGINLYINRNLLRAFYRTNGRRYALLASLYYTLIYPLAIGAGSLTGMLHYYRNSNQGNY
jgi:GT2 family glycosyltransferase